MALLTLLLLSDLLLTQFTSLTFQKYLSLISEQFFSHTQEYTANLQDALLHIVKSAMMNRSKEHKTNNLCYQFHVKK